MLFLRAYLALLLLEIDLSRADFCRLYDRVRRCSTSKNLPRHTAQQICSAIDRACTWYPKRVLCLQRSTATVLLLKKRGIPAQLVIGAQQFPFRAHAWAELDGTVINDKPYVPDIYAVLDRC